MDLLDVGEEVIGGEAGRSLDLCASGRVIAIEGVEWRMFGCRVYSVIVGEFCKGNLLDPVYLVSCDKESQILLDLLVDPFSLAISLRIVGCRWEEFDS